jgi:hypothetical protein
VPDLRRLGLSTRDDEPLIEGEDDDDDDRALVVELRKVAEQAPGAAGDIARPNTHGRGRLSRNQEIGSLECPTVKLSSTW